MKEKIEYNRSLEMGSKIGEKIKLKKFFLNICKNKWSVYIFTGIICFIMFIAIYVSGF